MFLFWLGKKGKRRKTITEAVFCGDCGQLPHSRMIDLLPGFLQNCISSFGKLQNCKIWWINSAYLVDWFGKPCTGLIYVLYLKTKKVSRTGINPLFLIPSQLRQVSIYWWPFSWDIGEGTSWSISHSHSLEL